MYTLSLALSGQTTRHNGRRPTLLARTHQLTASFAGDGNFAASMAALTLLVV
jgi:hypothetical protein